MKISTYSIFFFFFFLQRTSPADSAVNIFLGQIASSSEENTEEEDGDEMADKEKSKNFLARYVA